MVSAVMYSVMVLILVCGFLSQLNGIFRGYKDKCIGYLVERRSKNLDIRASFIA